jgi:hypothetical protein
MTNRRAKAAATATVLGLGAPGGVAPGATQQVGAGGATAAVVTSASGTAIPVSQTVAVHRSAGARAPIVTRASGGGLGGVPRDD